MKIKKKTINVPTTLAEYNTPMTSVNVTQSPPSSNVPAGAVAYWPAPALWYQQGKEASKKVYYEYLNAMSQYLNSSPNQSDRQLEMAGKMNSYAQSMIQGLELATDAAENISKRVRIGDQSAVLELRIVKETIERLLKTLWVHNTAAMSGKNPGLETRVLDAQLTGRINRTLKLNADDFGIPLVNAEEANFIWQDQPTGIVPPEQSPPSTLLTGQEPSEEEPTVEENTIPVESTPDEFNSQQTAPAEEFPIEEQTPAEDFPAEGESPTEEEVTAQGALSPEEEEIPIEEMSTEEAPEEEMQPDIQEMFSTLMMEIQDLKAQVQELKGEELPDEYADEEEIPEEESVEEEEVPVEEEEGIPEEETQEEVPVEEETEGIPTEEEVSEEEIPEEEVPVEEETEGIPEEEVPGEETVEETPEGEVSEEEEPVTDEDTIYCIICDQEVTMDDIKNCENESCPFKNMFTEEPPPVKEPVEEIQKHFILVNTDDHSECKTCTFIVKEFTGVEGEYCLTCNKAISYSFEQKTWKSEDAKRWVNKQLKIKHIKEKSSEVIIQESVDKIPETVLKEWLDESKASKKQETLEIKESEIKGVLKEVLEEAFSPISHRLKALEA